MRIALSKTREQFPLSYRKILKKTVARTLLWVFILLAIWGFLGFAVSSNSESNAAFAGISIIFFVLIFAIVMMVYLYQRWYFAVYFYDLTDDYVVIKKGPITPREITIPYERIQDVYVDQDLLDRIFGIYDVYISSATISSGMAAHIDGVEKAAADGLRAQILQTVSARISKKGSTVVPAQL